MYRVVVHHNQQKYAWELATREQAIRDALDARRSEGLWVERIEDRFGRVAMSRTQLDALFRRASCASPRVRMISGAMKEKSESRDRLRP
jgi:hypothetical protein